MDLSPGTTLLGKYRVDALIGTGGMGQVVRASHLYLNQPVAIKLLLAEMADSESTVARFLREAQSTVRLRSEHIARVMDVGTLPDGTPFMVMEFLDGNDLNQILRHHGPQTPAVVVDLMLQACEGMAEAHALGIIHRDIKPSNFFITQRPDGSMLLKILDFGISKTAVNYEDLTGTQTVIGTPSYMAPEQMKSGRSCDARSDIWAIGIVMYQLLCGRPPFVGETYADLVIRVGVEPPSPIGVPLPAGLGEVILRCLQKDPSDRQQTVGELARMLAPFATDPVAAAQSAARSTRILSNRGGQQQGVQGSPLAANGGLAAPVPLSPAQLTPRTWPPSSTSISQGAGQMTYRTRTRGVWVVAAIALVAVAGTGGYLINAGGRSADLEPHVQAPPPRAAASPTTAPPAGPPPASPGLTTATATTPTTTTPAATTPAATTPAATTPTAATPGPGPSDPSTVTRPGTTTATRSATPSDKTDVRTDTKTVKTDAKAVKTDAKNVASEPRKTAPPPARPSKPEPTVTTTKAEPKADGKSGKAETRSGAKGSKPAKPAKPTGGDDLFDTRH